MTTKEVMKAFGVVERTVRRWVERECPHTKDEKGNLVFDANQLAKWRLGQWTEE